MSRISAGRPRSIIDGQAQISVKPQQPITFSFAYLNRTQGHTLEEWHEQKLLVKMITRFRDFGMRPLYKCLNEKFKKYPYFPPQSKYKHPPEVPPDAEWASMHLGNMPCVIGHVIHDVFYVVFLDGDHEFWPTAH